MHYFSRWIILPVYLSSVFFTPFALANGWLGHIGAGYASPQLSNDTSYIWMNQTMQNRYSGTSASNNLLVGIGALYEWEFSQASVALGGSAYYLHTIISGLNTPFINWSDNTAALNDHGSGNSYAFLLEPKITWTSSAIQPYFFAGIGLAFNRLSQYSETPQFNGSGAAPTGTPFANQSNTNLAWEAGLGIQFPFTMNTYRLTVSIDYRYLNFGKASFGKANSSSGELNLGKLQSNVVNAQIGYYFS